MIDRLTRDPLAALLAALSALTAAGVGLTGEITPFALIIPPIALVSLLLHARGHQPGKIMLWAFRFIAVGFLVHFGFCVLTLRLLQGAVALTVPVQAWLLVQPRDLGVRRRLALLSFFQLVALSASTTQVFFLIVLFGWVLAAPALLTLLSLESSRPSSLAPLALPRGLVMGGLRASAVLLVACAIGFVSIPRYEAGMLRQLAQARGHLSGFSDRVSLGDIESIRRSDRVVMHVRTSGEFRGDLRWRGIALDSFSGREWSVTPTERVDVNGIGRLRLHEDDGTGGAFEQEFAVEAMGSRAVFHAGLAHEYVTRDFAALERDSWGNISRLAMPRSRVRYAIVSRSGPEAGPELQPLLRQRCLQLPDLDSRMQVLARSLGEGAQDDAERIRRVLRHVHDTCHYSLDVHDVGVEDPVSRFLLDGAPGHCEYFATAAVLLLRMQGVPARVVNGFLPGTWSGFFRSFVVRDRDAHSWAEAWLPERGWVTVDATPSDEVSSIAWRDALTSLWEQIQIGWDDNVIGFSSTFQLRLLLALKEWGQDLERWLGRARLPGLPSGSVLEVTAVLAALSAGGLVLRRVLLRRERPRVAWFSKVLALARRRGHVRAPGQTALEFARGAAKSGDEAAPLLLEAARLYHAERFGRATADPARVKELLSALSDQGSKRRVTT